MGNIAGLFGSPPPPKPGPLPSIPSRSRNRNRNRKDDNDNVDIPTLARQTNARIERFAIQRERAQKDAKAIWDDPKNHNIPHQRAKALNYMKQATRAEDQVATLTVLLSNTEGVEASVNIAENQKFIASQMRQVKTIVDKQSVDLPNIDEIVELKEDIDDFRQKMSDRNDEFNKLFSEPTMTSYEEMTLEEEESLMHALDCLVAPEADDERPPDNPGADAEKILLASEEDLDRLLDELPAASTSSPRIPAAQKRKVALML